MKKLSVIFTAIVALVFFACATTKIDTPEKKCLVARTELNVMLEQYLVIQDNIPMSGQATIRESFIAADMALDMWEANLNTVGYDYAPDYQAWIKAKQLIFSILREVYHE